jgi:DNA mismatch repair protein MutL
LSGVFSAFSLSFAIAGLLADLAACGHPHACPHGRPVFIRLTRRDIERLFKRR